MKIDQSKPGVLTISQKNMVMPFLGGAAILFGLVAINFKEFDITNSGTFIPLIMLIVGIGLILFWKRKTVDLDKNMNLMTVTNKALFSKKEEKYALNLIIGVEYTESFSSSVSNGKRMTTKNTALDLVFNNAARYNVFKVGDSASIFNTFSRGGRNQAERVAVFLGVPLKSFTPSDALDALRQGITGQNKGNI